MNTKHQWENPAETLDIIIGILTGLPIGETWGTDAIGTAQDVMREVMELRAKVNERDDDPRETPKYWTNSIFDLDKYMSDDKP